MVWPLRTRRVRAEPPTAPPAAEPVVEAVVGRGPVQVVHRSPGLAKAIGGLDPKRSCAVLDLGPAMSSTVSFFCDFRCRLRIVDLLANLIAARRVAASIPAPAPGGVGARERRRAQEQQQIRVVHEVVDSLLPAGEPELDVVLAWDILDHLDRATAQIVVQRLGMLCRPGARLLAMVTISRERAIRPGCYGVLGPDRLEYRATRLPPSRAQALHPAAVEQLLAGFETMYSVVLRNGLREWVATRHADPSR